MLMVSPPWATAVFLARIVIPFSRSRSPESRTRSATPSFARKAPDCHSIASTSVVLPWSTCATIATLRRSSLVSMGTGMGKPRSGIRVGIRLDQPREPPFYFTSTGITAVPAGATSNIPGQRVLDGFLTHTLMESGPMRDRYEPPTDPASRPATPPGGLLSGTGDPYADLDWDPYYPDQFDRPP